ncbi:hypothetical protein GA0115255_115824 [Streptomyces sp. Ncost-T6T-2b]|nr:hypothetical protein GA0115255_115824 [Streptomyces sp. Ncost-T6T-2b]
MSGTVRGDGLEDRVEEVRALGHLGHPHPAQGEHVGSQTYAAGDPRAVAIAGDAVLVDDDPAALQGVFGDASGQTAGPDVQQDHVGVGTAGQHVVAPVVQLTGEGAGGRDDATAALPELRGAELGERPGLRGDRVEPRSALEGGEDPVLQRGTEGPAGGGARLRVPAQQDQPAPRAVQLLVRAGGRHMGHVDRTGMDTGGDQARDVRDVRHQIRTDLVGHFAEVPEVDGSRIRTRPAEDEPRPVPAGQFGHGRVVDQPVPVEAVAHGREEASRHRDGGPVREVTPGLEVHAEHGVPGGEQRAQHHLVGGGTGVRLDIGVRGAEGLLRTAHGEPLHLVDELAARVIPVSGVPLGGHVAEGTRLAHQDRGVGRAGRRDHRERLVLADLLPVQQPVQLLVPGTEQIGAVREGPVQDARHQGVSSRLSSMTRVSAPSRDRTCR